MVRQGRGREESVEKREIMERREMGMH